MSLAGLSILTPPSNAREPVSAEFTYQGELYAAGAPATGTFDIRFRLYDAPSAGNQIGSTLCTNDVAVENGRFAASLDFSNVFSGQKQFLEVEVRQDAGLDCSDASGYTVLSPRQELTATPNASFAHNAAAAATAADAANLNGQSPGFYLNAANLTGTVSDSRLSSNVARLDGNQTFTGQTSVSNPANTFSGIFSGNGAGLLNLSGANIAAGTITRSRMGADVESILSQWTPLPQTVAPLDAIAWGNNDFGQTTVPVLPSGVMYTAVAGGNAHSLALRSDGTVVAWGANDFGQTTVPALPSGVTYTGVAGGGLHSLALRDAVSPPRLSSPTAVAASSFVGSGAALTNLNAANVTGTLAADRIPSLDASKITTGTLAAAQIPNLDASKITTGTLAAAQIPNLDASKIATGTLPDARLSPNIALKNAANAFTSTGVTSFAGKVGIGTTTPSTQFALEAVSISDTQIALTGGPATGGAIPPRTWSIQSSSVTAPPNSLTGSFQIVDRTATASRLLIDTNGNVGIGTTTPTQRLTVAGNMNVTGSLAKGGGSFKIDHPLDPENKYLYHSFVESPDMMNIYNGNITTDGSGYATITLPDYFEALNRDFRYQLTVINEADTGEFLWAQVVKKLRGNQFTIRSSRGNLEVSWQITGIRHDAWAEKNRIPNSVDKVGSEKGKYLHPEAFNQPADRSVQMAPATSGH